MPGRSSQPSRRKRLIASVARISGYTFIHNQRASKRLRQLVEQRLGVFQIGGVEAFGEPAVDRREQLACLATPALLAPQPGEARGGAQFLAASALLAGDREGGAKRLLGLRRIGKWQPTYELTAQAMNFCAPAPHAGGGRFCQCIVQSGKAFL